MVQWKERWRYWKPIRQQHFGDDPLTVTLRYHLGEGTRPCPLTANGHGRVPSPSWYIIAVLDGPMKRKVTLLKANEAAAFWRWSLNRNPEDEDFIYFQSTLRANPNPINLDLTLTLPRGGGGVEMTPWIYFVITTAKRHSRGRPNLLI